MINAEEERRKAMLWVLPMHILIGIGTVVPIVVLLAFLLFDFDKTVEIVIAIIMIIILAKTVHTVVKAIHSVPTNEVHLVVVRQGIYYSIWKSGDLHFLFNNWPLKMRFAKVNLQKIKIPFLWKETNKDTIQLADTSIEGEMLIEIRVVDPMLSHFETEGGFEDGVKPLVLSIFKDYVETVLAEKTEEETRHINGPTLLSAIQNKYPDMDIFLKGRGIKLESFFFSGEPLQSIKDARARETVAEHDAKTGVLTGKTRANIKIAEIDALKEQFISEGMNEQKAADLAREIWRDDRFMETIAETRGVISGDTLKGLSVRRHREATDED